MEMALTFDSSEITLFLTSSTVIYINVVVFFFEAYGTVLQFNFAICALLILCKKKLYRSIFVANITSPTGCKGKS